MKPWVPASGSATRMNGENMQNIADDQRLRFKQYFENMDYTEIKHISADVSLRQFMAGMFSHQPWWLALLFRLRGVLAWGMGLVHDNLPDGTTVRNPETISFEPGENVLLFTVREAEEGLFWIGETPPDKHLMAHVGIVANQLESGMVRYDVFTTVRYLHWTGPVYFNLIRPFHHLVVNSMMRAGAMGSKHTD